MAVLLPLPIQLDAGFQQIKSEGGGMHSVHSPRYDASGGNGLHDSEMPAGESFSLRRGGSDQPEKHMGEFASGSQRRAAAL
jgi:hypothetical protein